MAKLSDGFVALARDTSETHKISDVQKGYRNLVQKARYTARVTTQTDMSEAFNLGTGLTERLFTDAVSNTIRGGSGAMTFPGYNNSQSGKTISACPSYAATYMSWNENEVKANLDPRQGPDYIKAQFEKLYAAKEQIVNQDFLDEYEGTHWMVPDQTAMEKGDKALSIPYYITENTLGTSGHALQEDGSVITQINGVTVANTNGKYDNVRRTYDTIEMGDSADGTDLIGVLIGAKQRASWEGIPVGAQHGSLESMPEIVLCSDWGLDLVRAAYRKHPGNPWGPMETTAGGLTLAGMTFMSVDALATAALYSNHASSPTGLAAETAAVLVGPRFYGISRAHMRQCFQEDTFMKPDPPERLTQVGGVYEWVQIFKTAHQLWCPDRRRHFIVSPSTSI